jgi:chaperonin cofactor prefoldin
MSYQDAKDSLLALGNKSAGDLIRANDWNNLVIRITDMGDELNGALLTLQDFVGTSADTSAAATLSGRVQTLEEQDVVLREEYDNLQTQLAPLLDQFNITLQTTSVNAIMGQTAVISARVSNLSGEVPNPRPWVDFVCTWGRLSAQSGFTTRPGEDGKSISVQVNSEGIASIRVMAAASGSLNEAQSLQLGQFFQTSVGGGGGSVGEAIINSATSSDNTMQPVYQMISQQYQVQSGVNGLQQFADSFYADSLVNGGYHWGTGFVSGSWQDHRTTVLAFVKADSDPTTPDQSRGVSSIQLNFRDWVSPWIIDYFDIPSPEIDDFVPQFIPRIIPDDLRGSLIGFNDEVLGLIQNDGLIGRHRGYKLADTVIGQVGAELVNPVPFMSELRQTSQQAIAAQQTMDVLQVAMPEFANNSSGGASVLQAMIGQASQSAGVRDGVANVRAQITDVENVVGVVNEQVSSVSSNVTSLNTRLAQTESRGQSIQTSLLDISSRVDEIPTLDESGVRTRLQEISAVLGVIRTGVDNFPIGG